MIRSKVVDPMVLRRAAGTFPTGVTVIAARDGSVTHAMTANSFASVSLSPPLILVSLAKRSRMHAILPNAGRFGISILAQNQENIALHFAGRRDGARDVDFDVMCGTPVIEGALAHLACSLSITCEAGDHTVFIGNVDETMRRDGKPLVFFGGQFTSLREAHAASPIDLGELVESVETHLPA